MSSTIQPVAFAGRELFGGGEFVFEDAAAEFYGFGDFDVVGGDGEQGAVYAEIVGDGHAFL